MMNSSGEDVFESERDRVMDAADEHGRPSPPSDAGEGETLVGFLEFQRATFAWRCRGLLIDELHVTVAASSMTLAGMLKHLAFVEDYWFSEWLAGSPPRPPWSEVDWDAEPDWDWTSALNDDLDSLWARWDEAVSRSRTIVSTMLLHGDLGQPAKKRGEGGESPSLRWILAHMVEEYARHNGHADLIRESIDGVTGE